MAPILKGDFMILAEITKDIVGSLFNDGKIYVTRVTDGTMETVSKFTWRYKFPTGPGKYLRDKEEKLIIRESDQALFGFTDPYTGKQLGTELIEVVCGDPGDKHVFWVENPKFWTKVLDRDPITKRAITVTTLVKGAGKHCMGTYDEFLAVVNADGTENDFESPEPPVVDDLSELDDEYIKANYEAMSDKEMGEYFNIDEKAMRDYRVKTLKLKKKAFGKK